MMACRIHVTSCDKLWQVSSLCLQCLQESFQVLICLCLLSSWPRCSVDPFRSMDSRGFVAIVSHIAKTCNMLWSPFYESTGKTTLDVFPCFPCVRLIPFICLLWAVFDWLVLQDFRHTNIITTLVRLILKFRFLGSHGQNICRKKRKNGGGAKRLLLNIGCHLQGHENFVSDAGAYLLGNMRRTETKNIGHGQRRTVLKDKIRQVTVMQGIAARVLFGIASLQVFRVHSKM
jgi:hypothetical protein